MAYFLWRIFGSQCPFVVELTGLLAWSEMNQVTFDRQVKNSHNATAFVANVSRFLGQYLNSCVAVSRAAGLSVPGSCTPVYLSQLLQEISWRPYHGVYRLPPEFITLLHQQDMPKQDAVRATPGDHETRLRHEEDIQAAACAAGGNGGGRNGSSSGGGSCGGSGGGSGGGGGGGRGGGDCSLGGRDRPHAKGTVYINQHHLPNLALLPGKNTRDVLRTFALPTLGRSTWSKRWHHRGCCFENFPLSGSHVAPPAPVCTLVADAVANERNPQERHDG